MKTEFTRAVRVSLVSIEKKIKYMSSFSLTVFPTSFHSYFCNKYNCICVKVHGNRMK